MNNTRMPPTINHVMFIDTRFFSVCVLRSLICWSIGLGGDCVVTAGSPVFDPSLSPLLAIAAPPATPNTTNAAIPTMSSRPLRLV
jgi:hypothetical protein